MMSKSFTGVSDRQKHLETKLDDAALAFKREHVRIWIALSDNTHDMGQEENILSSRTEDKILARPSSISMPVMEERIIPRALMPEERLPPRRVSALPSTSTKPSTVHAVSSVSVPAVSCPAPKVIRFCQTWWCHTGAQSI